MSVDVDASTGIVSKIAERRSRLEEHSAWAEENGRLHPESIEELAQAGVFRMRRPARFGGLESSTRELVAVASALAAISGSLAWTATVYWIPTWMAGLFPEPAQQEIFAEPDCRVSGTLSPGGEVRRVAGGVRISGRWQFMTGAHHAHWNELVGIEMTPDGPLPVLVMVPAAEVTLVDDWHTSGLRGTGSVTLLAQDVFVPDYRALPLPLILEGVSAGAPPTSIHGAPLLPVAAASSVGTALGLADRALAVFMERVGKRKITYTGYDSQAAAPMTHHQVSAATMKLDEAHFHADRMAGVVDSKTALGSPWTLPERILARADMGAAVRLCRDAVDLLATASGGSSVYLDHPIRAIQQDLQAMGLHALMNPDVNQELHGRMLCGQEPDTLYF